LQRLLFNPLMKRRLGLLALVLLLESQSFAQEPAGAPTEAPLLTPTPPPKRGLLGRVLHPFSSSDRPAEIKNPKLRGLTLDLEISPQPLKLSEVRQLEVKVTLINRSKRAIDLDFPTDQRIEIQLLNSAEAVLTKWSENHAVSEKPGSVLINPQEHLEYKEMIATRDLAPNKVFTVEVFFPKYPELRARQKFMTAP
jgi:hypothetical protein